MIKLKPFRQTPGLCGPAALKMVMDYYGISVSEGEIAKRAGSTRENGTSIEGLMKAARYFGFKTFTKTACSLGDLRYFMKKGIPVIVDWFSEDDGHYSVVVDVTKTKVILMDPELRKFLIYARRREIPCDKFMRIWFDYKGDYIKRSKDMVLRLILVVTPFKVKI
ncbi:MAG: cysteine peptidase family C39 domain-containing protein [Candidatus Pacebacteria bacterium]|nr:cysteine peptidase family C39 domain-containing protein [Candidatus Paceibacterota bacterium]